MCQFLLALFYGLSELLKSPANLFFQPAIFIEHWFYPTDGFSISLLLDGLDGVGNGCMIA
jgi:hypothetical protein